MKIDPNNITVTDIKRYEKLMKGTPIGASSNATQQSNPVHSKTGAVLFTKHHWVDTTGPLQIEFKRPTSLISLNIELTFNCLDHALLVQTLSKQQNNGSTAL
jgi:hypothetical protein